MRSTSYRKAAKINWLVDWQTILVIDWSIDFLLKMPQFQLPKWENWPVFIVHDSELNILGCLDKTRHLMTSSWRSQAFFTGVWLVREYHNSTCSVLLLPGPQVKLNRREFYEMEPGSFLSWGLTFQFLGFLLTAGLFRATCRLSVAPFPSGMFIPTPAAFQMTV